MYDTTTEGVDIDEIEGDEEHSSLRRMNEATRTMAESISSGAASSSPISAADYRGTVPVKGSVIGTRTGKRTQSEAELRARGIRRRRRK
jgi:hypothetical protein